MGEIDEERKQEIIKSALNEEYESEYFSYFRELLETSALPDELKKDLWGLFDRTTILAKFHERDINVLLAYTDSLLADIRIYIPAEQYTPELCKLLSQIKMLHYKMLCRAREGFERLAQETKISQVAYTEQPIERPSTGPLGTIGRFFGLGGRK